jgi:hypothetical protein
VSPMSTAARICSKARLRPGYYLAVENRILATPGGFEPPTNSLEGCCSNPLSYGAVMHSFQS